MLFSSFQFRRLYSVRKTVSTNFIPRKGGIPIANQGTSRKELSLNKSKKLLEKQLAQSVKPLYFRTEQARIDYLSKFVEHNQDTTAMFTVSTVTHKTDDTRHPLIMLTNREGFKYFFGKIPEGSQRVLNEQKVKLGKLKSVFLTGTLSSWSEIGGLPGLFLTMSDATKMGIDVFTNSSRILSFIVATWRSYVFRRGVELKICEAGEDGIIADSNIAVRAIKIESNVPTNFDETKATKIFQQLKKLATMMFPLDTSKVNDRNPNSYKSDPSETEIQTHVKLPHPDELAPAYQQKSVNYLIRFIPVRGKFDPIKAKALGLKPGAKFRALSQGESVTNDEGVLILPEQVVDPPKSFPRLLILDIPNNAYLQNTIDSQEWFTKGEAYEEEIGIVYHLLGDDIDFESSVYQDFINKFPSGTKHIISHSKLADNTLVFKTTAVDLLKLKCIQQDNFNLPNISPYIPLNDANIFKLHLLQQFHISNDNVIADDSLISNDSWSDLFDTNIPQLQIQGADKSQILNQQPISLNIKTGSLKDQIHVVTLGTGSAIPSIQRNVISSLVRIPYYDSDNSIKVRSILLDGGENTLGSMLRNFGHLDGDQFKQIFQELRLIHLSHLHADHHLGLISVINKWFEINSENDHKLYLVIPWQYNTFVSEWYKFEGQLSKQVDVSRLVYLSCEEFIADRNPQYEPVEMDEFEVRFDNNDLSRVIAKVPLQPRREESIKELYENLGITSIQTVRALHCAWAYSISISFDLKHQGETFKISYSGDTRPNPKFVEIGYGSDLLIHESSLDNELIEEAIAKKHSTMIEAVNVSRFMNCPKVILTHFSTRYSNKNSISTDCNMLMKLSSELDAYLRKYRSKPNIFSMAQYSNRPIKGFEELDICFAFDMMNIKYSGVNCQKQSHHIISRIFQIEIDDEKREREIEKMNEKREAKRIQRLSLMSSKRRKSGSPEI